MKKKKQYSTGGQLLATGASFIPGVGGILSPLISAIDKSMAQNKPKDPLIPELPNSNIFGNFAFGGPILSPTIQESTFVQPRPLQNLATSLQPIPGLSKKEYRMDTIHNSQPAILARTKAINAQGLQATKDAGLLTTQRPEDSTYDRLGGYGTSNKAKSRDRFREKALGGLITDDFMQYDTGSHASGMDQTVNEQGIPAQGENAVQNKENTYKQYVMSDVLKNPETGNTFNIDAAKANKKHSNARFQDTEKNLLDFKMSRLQMLNDVLRKAESKKMYGGGYLGDPPRRVGIDGREYNYISDAPQADEELITGVPPADNPFDIQVEFPSDRNLAGDPSQIMNAPELQLGNPAVSNIPSFRSFNSPRSQSTDNTNYQLDSRTFNGLGLLSKSIGLAGSINDAFRPAQKEDAILPNYREADQYMKSANIDYTQARQDASGISNIAGNTNRSLSSNPAQFQGREQARLASLQDALGRIDMQQNNAQSQLNLTKGQYELNKANRNRDIEYQNQENNLQNQANTRFADRVLFQELDNIGSSFNKAGEMQKYMQNQKDVQQFNNSQIMLALQNKYPNVKIKDDIMTKFKSGKISLDEFLEYVPDDFKQEIKKG